MIAWDVAVLNWDTCIVYSSCVICLHLPAFSNLNLPFICSSAAASFNITNIYIKTSINTTPSHHHLSLRLRKVSFITKMNLIGVALRGAVHQKCWVFVPTWGRKGLSQSQLCVKVFQNIICLGTVHKCDETHTQTWNLSKNLHDPIFGWKNFTHWKRVNRDYFREQ